MRVDFSDGSFMLSWARIQARYNPDGTVKYAEYKRTDKGGFGFLVAVSVKHTKVRAWLEEQGKSEAALLAQGILKRKTP